MRYRICGHLYRPPKIKIQNMNFTFVILNTFLNKSKPLPHIPVLYLSLSERIFSKNNLCLVKHNTSSYAAEMDKNIVHSAREGFVSFFFCLKVVFLALVKATLIQILFVEEGCRYFFCHLTHTDLGNAVNPDL